MTSDAALLTNNPYKLRVESEAGDYILNLSQSSVTDIRTAISKARENLSETVVELCSGSGIHLLSWAKRRPAALLIGFELRYKRSYRTIEKARLEQVINLKVVRADARHFNQFFPAHSVSGIFVNFPDPWDRRRWLKNRVLSQEFFLAAAEVLHPGGFISIKTDHRGYFDSVLKIISQHPSFKTLRISYDLHQETYAGFEVKTEFEQLFISQKLPIHFIELQFIPARSLL